MSLSPASPTSYTLWPHTTLPSHHHPPHPSWSWSFHSSSQQQAGSETENTRQLMVPKCFVTSEHSAHTVKCIFKPVKLWETLPWVSAAPAPCCCSPHLWRFCLHFQTTYLQFSLHRYFLMASIVAWVLALDITYWLYPVVAFSKSRSHCLCMLLCLNLLIFTWNSVSLIFLVYKQGCELKFELQAFWPPGFPCF